MVPADEMDDSSDEEIDTDAVGYQIEMDEPPTRKRSLGRDRTCDINRMLREQRRDGWFGLRYAPGPGKTAKEMASRASVDRLPLQRMLLSGRRNNAAMCSEWNGLSKTVRTALKQNWPDGGRQPVTVIVALWFGMQIKKDDHSEEWPEVMMALWLATRTAGPFKWQRRSADFMENPTFSFRADCLACIGLMTSNLDEVEMPEWGSACFQARKALTTLVNSELHKEASAINDRKKRCVSWRAGKGAAPPVHSPIEMPRVSSGEEEQLQLQQSVAAARRASVVDKRYKPPRLDAVSAVAAVRKPDRANRELMVTMGLEIHRAGHTAAAVAAAIQETAIEYTKKVTAANKRSLEKDAKETSVRNLLGLYGFKASRTEDQARHRFDAYAAPVEKAYEPKGGKRGASGSLSMETEVVKKVAGLISGAELEKSATEVLRKLSAPRAATIKLQDFEDHGAPAGMWSILARKNEKIFDGIESYQRDEARGAVLRVILEEHLGFKAKTQPRAKLARRTVNGEIELPDGEKLSYDIPVASHAVRLVAA